MIIELDTKLADLPQQLNMNQLVFLSMVLDDNHKNNQDVQKIVSLITDDEISYLVSQRLITSIEKGNSITYQATDQLKNHLKPEKDWFDQFYDMYPVYIMRPDGVKTYLRANVNKCRRMFNSNVGRSSAMAQHLIDCLKFELDKKSRTGKLMYMKTMWRWLVDHQWEESEEEMQDQVNETKQQSYGTELI